MTLPRPEPMPPNIAIIGGGPAGLMAAEVLSQHDLQIGVYDAMRSVGRKFLIAGRGGLNLTHSEPYPQFLTRYGNRQPQLEPMLAAFGPQDVQRWVHDLGFETFVGSSGRIFPTDMKAAPLLRAWLKRLRGAGVRFHLRHHWQGWVEDVSLSDVSRPEGQLRFATPAGERLVQADAVILALGGGSWAKLGSTGAWVPLLVERGVDVAPLRPSNCGFDVGWTEHFSGRFAGHPLKAVRLTFTNAQGVRWQQQGEFVITKTGVEGSLIYAVSAILRDEIEARGTAVIHLDLAPDRTKQYLAGKLSRPRGSRSIANHLKSRVHLHGVKAGLLHEFLPPETFTDPMLLAQAIKSLPIPLIRPRPLDEAISSAGGVRFEALDDNGMIRILPGVFCAGEMLDWEAPTGGYLLTACLANGRAAAFGVLAWLKANDKP